MAKTRRRRKRGKTRRQCGGSGGTDNVDNAVNSLITAAKTLISPEHPTDGFGIQSYGIFNGKSLDSVFSFPIGTHTGSPDKESKTFFNGSDKNDKNSKPIIVKKGFSFYNKVKN